MKKKIIYGVLLILVSACSQFPSTKDEAKELMTEQVAKLKKNKAVTSHFQLIEKLIELSKSDVNKPEFVSSSIQGVEMTFNDSSEFCFIHVDKKMNEHEWLFFPYQTYMRDVELAMNTPIDSLPYDYIGGINEAYDFKEKTEHFITKVDNLEILVIVRTTAKQLPVINGETVFSLGVYSGRILMYDVKTNELLANINVTASNSESVDRSYGNGIDRVLDDLVDNVDQSITKALNAHFTIEGTVPSIWRVLDK